MFTNDLRFEGFTTQDWTRLAKAFRPRPGVEPSSESGGGVIVVTADGRPVKLLSTRTGRIQLTGARSERSVSALEWPVSLESLAGAFDASWAVELEWSALNDLMDAWADKLVPDHDAFDQVVEFLRAAQEVEAAGKLQAWPWKISAWPLPNQRLKLRALDLVCPDGKALVLGVFERGSLFTSVTLRRRGNGFDLLLGPEELREDMGLVSGDWTRDYRHLLRAVEQRVGPVAVGCFAELETLQKLSESSQPGSWAAAVAARDVVLSPVVPALAIPLGVDAGRAAFFAIRDLAERVGVGSLFGDASPFAPAFERVKAAVEDRDVVGLLGFDPFDLLRKLLARGDGDSN
ncbi:MAG: hypothetical protein KC766_38180 [Myxococcales bacterium]|nr:hypothetical protein [Myxococcales bacterium]